MSSTITEYTFTWPDATPNDVVFTGSFDDWKGSIHMNKDTANEQFFVTFPVQVREKFFFKFIVDGVWYVNRNYKTEVDWRGIENNFIDDWDLEQVMPKRDTGVEVDNVVNDDETTEIRQLEGELNELNDEIQIIEEKFVTEVPLEGADNHILPIYSSNGVSTPLEKEKVGEEQPTTVEGEQKHASNPETSEKPTSKSSDGTSSKRRKYKIRRVFRKNKKTGERVEISQELIELKDAENMTDDGSLTEEVTHHGLEPNKEFSTPEMVADAPSEDKIENPLESEAIQSDAIAQKILEPEVKISDTPKNSVEIPSIQEPEKKVKDVQINSMKEKSKVGKKPSAKTGTNSAVKNSKQKTPTNKPKSTQAKKPIITGGTVKTDTEPAKKGKLGKLRKILF